MCLRKLFAVPLRDARAQGKERKFAMFLGNLTQTRRNQCRRWVKFLPQDESGKDGGEVGDGMGKCNGSAGGLEGFTSSTGTVSCPCVERQKSAPDR